MHILAIGGHAGDMDLTAGAVLAQHILRGAPAGFRRAQAFSAPRGALHKRLQFFS